MKKSEFTYSTYISTTPEILFHAFIDAKTTKKYWQHANISDWKRGSPWEHRRFDKKRSLDLVGKVVESSPPKRLILSWAFPADEASKKKHSRVAIEIKPVRNVVRLTVKHDRLEPGSQMLEGITEGWPKVISSLKSLLETGRPLPRLW
jgi:uncharacterized protein YndB with AHSA1/START domain